MPATACLSSRAQRGILAGPERSLAALGMTCGAYLNSSHQKSTRNDHTHDLVGALEDLVHPKVAQVTLDGKVLQIAVATVQLQRVVHDVEADVGREAFGHRGGLRRFR